jgi:chromosome segregation ATPase|tara:strand:+ start:322 stop:714 length:393 start_codon:yes stop_codon:yes gene_type:complete
MSVSTDQIENIIRNYDALDHYANLYCDGDEDEVNNTEVEDLKPSHYKNLRRMIEFIENTEENTEEMKELEKVIDELKDLIESYKNTEKQQDEEIEKLEKKNIKLEEEVNYRRFAMDFFERRSHMPFKKIN